VAEQSLYLWEIRISREDDLMNRDSPGVAWVSASTEKEALRFVEAQLGTANIAHVESYELEPPRLIALRPSAETDQI
jgi:hypothetical protein